MLSLSDLGRPGQWPDEDTPIVRLGRFETPRPTSRLLIFDGDGAGRPWSLKEVNLFIREELVAGDWTSRLQRATSWIDYCHEYHSCDGGLVAKASDLVRSDPIRGDVLGDDDISEDDDRRTLSDDKQLNRATDLPPLACRTKKKLPRRVLDLRQFKTNGSLKLVESLGMVGTYVCLSYTWGPSNSCLTTPLTFQANLDSISYATLPQSYKDAISVTTTLGIPFLWIDGLCIIQQDDGLADWKEQSAQMADIYANAILVIAAANSRSVEEGFLGASRLDRKLLALESRVPRGQNDEPSLTLYARPTLDHSWLGWSTLAEPKREGTLSRSWCFQEEVLAARLLTFYGGEMNFQCLGDEYRCECGFPAEALGLVAIKELYEPRLSLGDFETPNWMWQSTVEHYTRRKLTVGTDRLTALSGVVRIMQSALRTRYVAGHWWDRDFLCSLCWAPVRSAETESRTTADYVAPSWSWAAHNGPVTMWIPYGDSSGDNPSPRFLGNTAVKGLRMYPATSDATGAVAGGFVTVRGIFLPVRVRATPTARASAVMRRNKAEIPFFFDRTVDSAGLSGAFFCWIVCCLPAISHSRRRRRPEAYCLMVLRSRPEGVCERVGFTDHDTTATDKSMVFFQGYRQAVRVATIV